MRNAAATRPSSRTDSSSNSEASLQAATARPFSKQSTARQGEKYSSHKAKQQNRRQQQLEASLQAVKKQQLQGQSASSQQQGRAATKGNKGLSVLHHHPVVGGLHAAH